MAMYQKKTLTTIEQYKNGMETGFVDGKPFLKTNVGDMFLTEDMYIATGVEGEKYPIYAEYVKEHYEHIKEDLYRKNGVTSIIRYELGMEDGFEDGKPYLNIPKGRMYIPKNGLIAFGENGDRWAIKQEIFEKTYELVEE